MKTIEEYKVAPEHAGPRPTEKLLVQADKDWLRCLVLAEVTGVRAELWT